MKSTREQLANYATEYTFKDTFEEYKLRWVLDHWEIQDQRRRCWGKKTLAFIYQPYPLDECRLSLINAKAIIDDWINH